MANETNQSSLIVGTFFKLVTVEGVTFNFQNFWRDDQGVYVYAGEDYNFLPIEYNPPERNITLDNAETQINLPVTTEIISILEANNYFIEAIVEIYIMLQGFPSVPLIAQDKAMISSYSIQDSKESDSGALTLIISSPFNAVGGNFPNLIYTTGFVGSSNIIGYIPEVPVSNNPGIN
jgi:hypothetical protein